MLLSNGLVVIRDNTNTKRDEAVADNDENLTFKLMRCGLGMEITLEIISFEIMK